MKVRVIYLTARDAAAGPERQGVRALGAWGAWYFPSTRRRTAWQSARGRPRTPDAAVVHHVCTQEHPADLAPEVGYVRDRVVDTPWTCPSCGEELTSEMARQVQQGQAVEA